MDGIGRVTEGAEGCDVSCESSGIARDIDYAARGEGSDEFKELFVRACSRRVEYHNVGADSLAALGFGIF